MIMIIVNHFIKHLVIITFYYYYTMINIHNIMMILDRITLKQSFKYNNI